jgi:hypothetical protein
MRGPSGGEARFLGNGGSGRRGYIARPSFGGSGLDLARRRGWDIGRRNAGPRTVWRGGDRDIRRGRIDRRGHWNGRRIRRYGRRYAWGPGISFWFYDGYYYGDCEWLRRRAVVTGSRYWWRRYRQCRYYDWY